MKRLFSIMLMIAASVTLMAQQSFYTSSGQTIKGYVVAMTDDLFIYSQNKDLSEPFDTLEITDVYNILNENGSFEIVTPVDLVPDKGSILSKPLGELQYNNEKLISYKGVTITESEWLALASKAEVDEIYSRGKTLRRVGTPLWGVGLGLIGIGSATMLIGMQNNSKATYLTGESLAIFGAPMVLVGVPLHCVGNHLQKKSYQRFNAMSGKTSQATLNLQSSANGIGIALNF